jgi:hypothetical protein
MLAACACLVCVASAWAQGSPELAVSPVPTQKEPSPGTPRVTWSTGGPPGQVTVVNASGEIVFGAGAEGNQEAPWIAAGQQYEFRLYATAPERTLLAKLKIGETAQTQVVAPTTTPRDTPAVVNRLLQVLPFLAVLGLLWLAFAWARERRQSHA